MAKYSWHGESVLPPAIPMSNSVRTTVPAYPVDHFDLRQGDKLNRAIENGAVVIQAARHLYQTKSAGFFTF